MDLWIYTIYLYYIIYKTSCPSLVSELQKFSLCSECCSDLLDRITVKLNLYNVFTAWSPRPIQSISCNVHDRGGFPLLEKPLPRVPETFCLFWSFFVHFGIGTTFPTQKKIQCLPYAGFNFHQLAPLGRVGHKVAMSVCLCVCLSAPSGAVFC